jgi:trehalose/maltose transport system substrate-binding protein
MNMMKKIICLLVVCSCVFVYAKEKIVLKIAVGNDGKAVQATKAQAAAYMKLHPDIIVKTMNLPQSTDEQLAYFLQLVEVKSDEVDIIPVDAIYIGELAPILIDFYKYPKAMEYTKKTFPVLVENNIYEGKMLALPWFAAPSMLYYRTDLLKKYNLQVPKTWMELTKAAYKIQTGERAAGNTDFEGYVWQGIAYEGLTCNALEWIASNNGGTIVNNKKEVTLNNPNAIKAVQMAKNWIGTISPRGVLSMNEEKSRAIFQSGNAAFMRNWPYAYTLALQKGSVIRDIFDISPLPAGVNGQSSDVLGACMLGINKYSKHKEAAVDLALFLLTDKMQKLRTEITGGGPSVPSLYKDKDLLKLNPSYSKLLDAYKTAINRPSTLVAPNYARVSITFYKAVYSALKGDKGVEDVLKDAADTISKITGYPQSK